MISLAISDEYTLHEFNSVRIKGEVNSSEETFVLRTNQYQNSTVACTLAHVAPSRKRSLCSPFRMMT
jgi:hypothetical protein